MKSNEVHLLKAAFLMISHTSLLFMAYQDAIDTP